jgi:hypothetical protein
MVLENPTFKDYLAGLGAANVANAETIKEDAEVAAAPALSVVPPAAHTREALLAALLDKVGRLGFTPENLLSAANRDYGKTLLAELTPEEIARLDERLEAAAQKRQVSAGAPARASKGAR